jgi:hypothetical protein
VSPWCFLSIAAGRIRLSSGCRSVVSIFDEAQR